MATEIENIKKINILIEKLKTHLIKHQIKYLILFFILICGIVIGSNFLQNKPLIMGTESYALLTDSSFSNYSLFSFILRQIVSVSLLQWLVIIPIILGVLSIFLLWKIMNKFNVKFNSSSKWMIIFLIILIISPAFIFTYTTISAYSFVFTLMLGGFLLLMQKNKVLKLTAVLPFLLASTVDIFSSLFLLGLLLIFYYLNHQKLTIHDPENVQIKKNHWSTDIVLMMIFTIIIGTILGILFLKIPVTSGPFNFENRATDLISDLGGLTGVNLFTFFLAIIGLIYTWKKKQIYWAYLLLALTIGGYIYNTHTVFYLTIIIVFFAAFGLLKLWEREWVLNTLKKFTIFILILGLLFSTMTYLTRINLEGPFAEDVEALSWIKEHLLWEEIVFSAPENSYYIEYFAGKEPFYEYDQKEYEYYLKNYDSVQNLSLSTLTTESKAERLNLSNNLFNSTYTEKTFPILEKYNISMIYVTQKMRGSYPSDNGLLYLLKNEKFKMIHSNNQSEVWVYLNKDK